MTELPTEIESVPDRPLPVLPTESAQYKMPSVHREGHKFVAIAAVATLLVGFGLHWTTLAWLLAGLTIWVAAFFRDPIRVTASESSAPCLRVSVFMSVFDVHINRAPIAGTVRRVVYVPGKFLNADLDKASDDNERQYFIVDSPDGTAVAFTQIAGLVARRIMRFVQEGDVVRAGQRIGLIRFGSRVDVYLPAGYGCEVAVGQRAVAGETVLARLGAAPLAAAVRQ